MPSAQNASADQTFFFRFVFKAFRYVFNVKKKYNEKFCSKLKFKVTQVRGKKGAKFELQILNGS